MPPRGNAAGPSECSGSMPFSGKVGKCRGSCTGSSHPSPPFLPDSCAFPARTGEALAPPGEVEHCRPLKHIIQFFEIFFFFFLPKGIFENMYVATNF